MSYKIKWTNKESGYVGIGNILTKEIDTKGETAYRIPLDLDEAVEVCEYANRNYIRARHVVVKA